MPMKKHSQGCAGGARRLYSPNMKSVGEDMPHGMDTTIYMVHKVATEPGSRSSKKTRKEETESMRAEEKLVVENVYADSRRLRECSKYFETCMEDRWAGSKPAPSQLEFDLELQADVVYYRDCFSRMELGSLFQPIPSVDHCLELLKVASQIVFQEVVDLGIKYLSATPWSTDDEVKIRRICESGYISLDSEAHGDLIARLRKPLREKTQGEVLSLYLEHAFSKWATLEPEDRRVFEETFQLIVLGPNRHAAIESVEKEATKLLFSFKESNDNVKGFAWLYGLLRSVHAGESIVDLLVKERDIIKSMYSRHLPTTETHRRETYMVWTKLIAAMVQDVAETTKCEVLSLYLEHALLHWATPEIRCEFEETFRTIVSGPNRHAGIESVKNEATRLLSTFKKSNQNIKGFAWLYGLLRIIHANQSIIECLLKKADNIFKSICMRFYNGWTWETNMVWVRLIGGMLQDVLDGRLFLTSSERYTLFTAWREMCEKSSSADAFHPDDDLRELLTTFFMTFPFEERMRMMECWDGVDEFEEVMTKVYGNWRMYVLNDLASRHGQEVTAVDSREPSDSTE